MQGFVICAILHIHLCNTEIVMKCKAHDCDRDAIYGTLQLCQKHYFRYWRRGTLETIADERIKATGLSRKYRIQNPAGYQRIYEPTHTLANSDGYVYEHRFVAYKKYGDNLPACLMCGANINWDNCHIDHIDEDVTNNNIENLRPVCRGCNTTRTVRTKNVIPLTYNGVTKTVAEWARDESVNVAYNTILRRMRNGFSAHDCLYMENVTHKNTVAKKYKTKRDIFNER